MTLSQDTAALARLEHILTYCRPAWSATETQFIADVLTPLGTKPDAFGNEWRIIGSSPILWSCHTDTVHRYAGLQTVSRTGDIIRAIHPVGREDCLGADCGTGVWLMCEMMRANVPGTYVFHRAEETGGHGSAWIARHAPDRLAGITAAIAFDRAGTCDVITHQWAGQCASDAFALSLAEQLPPGYRPCDGGSFTDTANYMGLVAECSNVSIGYTGAHSVMETQSASAALKLRRAMLSGRFDNLTHERAPGFDCYDTPAPDRRDNMRHSSRLLDFIYDNPEVVADFLESLGYEAVDLEAHANSLGLTIEWSGP